MGNITLNGATSGQITLAPTAVAGTNTLTLPAKTGNIITSADTGTVSQAMLATNVAGNGPAFSVTMSVGQSIPASTFTKLQFDQKVFDTNTNFNTSTYRFTASVAGYYQINGQVFMSVNAGRIVLNIYKNGSIYCQNLNVGTTINGGTNVLSTTILYLAANDYVELYGYQEGSVSTTVNNSSILTSFTGALVRAA